MVKFENRVAQNKVSRFLEKSELIIFISDKSTSLSNERAKGYFQKEYCSSQFKKSQYASIKNAALDNLDDTKIQKNSLQIKRVKNKHVKKALSIAEHFLSKESNGTGNLSTISAQSNFFAENNVISSTPAEILLKEVTDSLTKHTAKDQKVLLKSDKTSILDRFVLDSVSEEFAATNNKLKKDSNFSIQGSNFIIRLQPKSFFILKKLLKDKNLSILGGFYKNCSIDHNQIVHLSKIVEENQIYYSLNNNIKNPSAYLINTISLPISINSVLLSLSKNTYARLCLTLAFLQRKL